MAVALAGDAGTQDWIWPLLAAIVLATLLGETFLTYRMVRRQTKPGTEVMPGMMPRPVAAAA